MHPYAFVVPPEVTAEILLPEQAVALTQAFDAGTVGRAGFSDTTELASYADLVQSVGRGEAACLAIAEAQGWFIASDEKRRFRRFVDERLGRARLLTTPGLYVLAIRAGILTVEDADHDKVLLEEHRFKKGFSSFRDVLG